MAERITIVVPVYNEAEGLPLFVGRLTPVLESLGVDWTVLFVNDGSVDSTLLRLRDLHDSDPRFTAISLSRNFGKETAIAAGLHYADGDAVILMDGDAQHPPEMLPAFLERWRAGFKVVLGSREGMAEEGALRRLYSRSFHALFRLIAAPRLPRGAVDFLLLDRKAVDAMNRLGERTRFSKGLYAWIGFEHTTIPFAVGGRVAGQSSWNFTRLLGFAVDGLVSFSTIPLKVWSYLGLVISACAMVYALVFLIMTLVSGTDQPGFPSLIVSIMFFSGVQLISLGVLGEYVARIYEEVKRRPLFLVGEEIGVTERDHGRRAGDRTS
ncbi:MAG TPA: glycosyltransferase family 2 protein [Kaistia sp.]|nr:glycosyltransferase family 2 protein [Kaistia sp.]